MRRWDLLGQEVSTTRVEGVGLGLRAALAEDILQRAPAELAWIECAPENYMRRGGLFPATLSRCAARWPIVTHGLTMSLGGADPLDDAYLQTLKAFLQNLAVPWHSDHLCFGSVRGIVLHDLLPLPFTRAAAQYLASRIRMAQDRLGVPMAVENISYYAHPGEAEMDEADFVSEVVRSAGCHLLLDVNNVYVNARNHGFSARAAIAKMPLDSVVQIHVAGHDDSDPRLVIDTHAEPVQGDVYDLLAWTLERTGPVPVLLERDGNFPPWETLCAEIRRLDAILCAAKQSERTRGAA